MPLLGLDRHAWEPIHERDLITAESHDSTDLFGSWFTETLVPVYHRLLGERLKVRLNPA
jgi:hypothetical protein